MGEAEVAAEFDAAQGERYAGATNPEELASWQVHDDVGTANRECFGDRSTQHLVDLNLERAGERGARYAECHGATERGGHAARQAVVGVCRQDEDSAEAVGQREQVSGAVGDGQANIGGRDLGNGCARCQRDPFDREVTGE